MSETSYQRLGIFLKNRRIKLDPTLFGFSMIRRRTPGLRREEVAQLSQVSTTWYTWLEQGRGGAPSSAVLSRISRTLMLSATEHEYLFLLAFGRPPEVKYKAVENIPSRLQRVLDSMILTPAYIKTPSWDVVA